MNEIIIAPSILSADFAHLADEIKRVEDAGADIITFHLEAAKHAHRIIQEIHAADCKAGIAINPATPLFSIEEIVPYVEMVLIMTVNPGFGGQKFIPTMTQKISRLRQIIDAEKFECDIEVDGGINPQTSQIVRDAGANILVAGSAIYGSKNIADAVKNIRG